MPSRPAPSPCARPFAARLGNAARRGSGTSTQALGTPRRMAVTWSLVIRMPEAWIMPDVSYSVYARSAVRCRGSSSSRLSAASRSSWVVAPGRGVQVLRQRAPPAFPTGRELFDLRDELQIGELARGGSWSSRCSLRVPSRRWLSSLRDARRGSPRSPGAPPPRTQQNGPLRGSARVG